VAPQLKPVVRSILAHTTSNPGITRAVSAVTRTGLVPEFVWKRLPVDRTFFVPAEAGIGGFSYSADRADGIGRALFWRGITAWEQETVPVFYRYARQSRSIIDIGGNTGIYSLIACAANPSARVRCFEPVPQLIDIIRKNIQLNGWESRCELYGQAVSDQLGSVKFHVPLLRVPKSGSLHVEGFRGHAGRLIDVVVTTIDAVCADDQEPVDLVKIDVEGFEDKALQGMTRVLDRSRPHLIVECNPDGPFKNVEAILSAFNYRFFHLRKDGAVPVPHIVPDPEQRFRNYLCTCPDRP
jgi:FkbM family methyltransferase